MNDIPENDTPKKEPETNQPEVQPPSSPPESASPENFKSADSPGAPQCLPLRGADRDKPALSPKGVKIDFFKKPIDLSSFVPEVSVTAIAAILLLIVLFDYFIYQSASQIGGLGWGVMVLLVGLIMWRVERPTASRAVIYAAGLVVIFAVRTIWQSVAMRDIIGFILLFILASSFRGLSLQITELTHSFWLTCLKLPLLWGGVVRTLYQVSENLPNWSRKGLRIGLAWFIPAVVVLVFLGIFTLANAVVESWMGQAWDWAWKQVIAIFDFLSIGRIFFWVCSFFLALWLLLPQGVKYTLLTPFLGDDESLRPPKSAAPGGDFNATVALNTLIAVNLLFVLYNAVDVVFLWFKAALPAGLNYSGYAHEGVFWLTMALALTSFVIGVIFIGGLNFHRRTRLLKILAWVWVVQNLILALNTFGRLQMYMDFNGLTRLRIVGAYGITLVVIGLLVVAFKMHRGRSFLWMVRRHLTAFGLALFVLAVTPRDWLVWQFNTRIILHHNLRPSIQLVVQPITAEGIPALIPLLDCPDQAIREGVAGILIREREKLSQLESKEKRWADKELSRSNALKVIRSVQPKLDQILPARTDAHPGGPGGDWQKAIDQLREYTRQWY
jgi:hypothetical protein